MKCSGRVNRREEGHMLSRMIDTAVGHVRKETERTTENQVEILEKWRWGKCGAKGGGRNWQNKMGERNPILFQRPR